VLIDKNNNFVLQIDMIDGSISNKIIKNSFQFPYTSNSQAINYIGKHLINREFPDNLKIIHSVLLAGFGLLSHF